jgi:flavorubredoxin
MLHWPDSMFTYLAGDALLFSNDAFGQHYASEALFNDSVAQDELWEECIKYYANILTPFSALVTRKIEELVNMKVPVEIIAPSHGIVWRKDPMQIVEKYLAWAKDYQEDRIAILYDSMWEGTRKLAEAIAQGISEASPASTISVMNTAKTDKNDVITDVFRSKAILVGSPTINKGILNSTAGILEVIEGLRFKGKKAAAFGCSGWSGEAPKKISEMLGKSGFQIVADSLACAWEPDDKALALAREYGRSFVSKL